MNKKIGDKTRCGFYVRPFSHLRKKAKQNYDESRAKTAIAERSSLKTFGEKQLPKTILWPKLPEYFLQIIGRALFCGAGLPGGDVHFGPVPVDSEKWPARPGRKSVLFNGGNYRAIFAH